MKLSISLTLSTIASMSIGSEARIGGGKEYEQAEDAGHHHRSMETASESSPDTFPVYIALEGDCPNCEVGLLDNLDYIDPFPRKKLGDVGCVDFGVFYFFPEKSHEPFYNVDWYVEFDFPGSATTGNITYGKANCVDIGNSNNAACDLPNLPENACVILAEAKKQVERRNEASIVTEEKMPLLPPALMPVQTAHVEVVPHAPCVGSDCMAGVSPYTVFVANTQQRSIQAGLIDGDDNPISYNDVKGGECIKIGDYVIPDAVTYFTNPKDGSGGLIFDDVADCEYIGNTNNAACDLPNLPENACVILV